MDILAAKRQLEDKPARELIRMAEDFAWPTVSLDDLKWLLAIQRVYQSAEMPISIPALDKKVELSQACLKGIQIKRVLGEGTYGVVSQACLLEDDCNYAVKVQYLEDRFAIDDFDRENIISSEFSVKGVGPKYFGGWTCEMEVDGRRRTFGILVTELWDGSLQQYIAQECTVPPETIQKLYDQIEQIHKLGYVHADIMRKNILVKIQDDRISDLTLTDFGLTKPLEEFKRGQKWIETLYEYYRDPAFKLNSFFDNHRITLTDLQLEPELLDYILLYVLASCNEQVPKELKTKIDRAIESRRKSLDEATLRRIFEKLLDDDRVSFLFDKSNKYITKSTDIAELIAISKYYPGSRVLSAPYANLASNLQRLLLAAYNRDYQFRLLIDQQKDRV